MASATWPRPPFSAPAAVWKRPRWPEGRFFCCTSAWPYAELGEEEQAGRAVAESEQQHRATVERSTSCPFPEEKLQGGVGLAVSAATYEKTTANAVATFDLYKQWPRNYFEADLFASINYDSSRDLNLT